MDDGLKAIPKKRRKKQAPPQPSLVMRVLTALYRAIGRALLTITLILLTLLGCILFKTFYYEKNDVFLVRPEDIVLKGNSTYGPEFFLATFDLTRPRNGFEILKSDIVSRLQQQMPIIKRVQMTYTPGGTLELWVDERMPLARLDNTSRALVVDDEGVIFDYHRSKEGYPVISGFDVPDQYEPGARLHDGLRCMLHLIAAANQPRYRLPSSIRRVTLRGNEPEDGLVVSLADGRKLTLAWPGMSHEKEPSEAMLRRLKDLGHTLRSPVNEGKYHFDATSAGRIAVSE